MALFIQSCLWSISIVVQRFLHYSLHRFFGLFFLAAKRRSVDTEESKEITEIAPNKDPISLVPTGEQDQVEYPEVITYVRIPGSWQRRARPDMHPNCFKIPEARPGEVVYVTKGHFLAWGGTAIIERLPSGEVIKTPIPSPLEEQVHRRNMRVEAKIYQKIFDKFGEHPRIPTVIKWEPESCCLTMEYLVNGNLGEYIRNHNSRIQSEVRHRWAMQAAEGLHILHSVDVIHCDISPRNFLLDRNLDLKISDFGGSSICGSEPSAVAGPRFLPPNFDWKLSPTVEDDLFSLGSLIYFIMTGEYPFEEIPSGEVERLYKSCQFPNTEHLICGAIVEQCWSQQVHSAEAVYKCLQSLEGHLL